MDPKPMTILATDALIVVDVQKDFCPGGALPVADGDAVVPVINALVPKFAYVVYTRDWHPDHHCSFSDAPAYVDKSWPVHCVAHTDGAAFHDDLLVASAAPVINKGTTSDLEAYSGFQGTSLLRNLRDKGVERIFVCGLATDYCVKHTVLDGLRNAFAVFVIEDAVRAVDVPAGTGRAAMAEMTAAGAAGISSGALL